jgi:two-component system, NarL family, nitrate/nitrite response regulator NarL
MRLVVCDDHAMFLDALADALARLGHEVVGTTSELTEVAGLVGRTTPEACLLDVWFDDTSSLDVARGLRARHPGLHVVLLTADVSREALAALEDGAVQAVAHKSWSLELIDETIRRVASGSPVRRLLAMPNVRSSLHAPRLTGRELEVLHLMAHGASTTEIRHRLRISEHTVRSHVRNVLAKLGAHTRVEAIRRAHDHGLVPAAVGK